MSTALVPETGVLLVERSDGRTAFGPVLRGELDHCLDCVIRRRRGSAIPLGELSAIPVTDLPADPQPVLEGHQLAEGRAHRFLPFPACRCPRAAALTAGRMTDAISERLGLVRDVRVAAASGDQRPALAEYVAVSRGARIHGTGAAMVIADGSGRGDTPEQAVQRAVSESLERYAAGHWGHSVSTTLVGVGALARVRATLVLPSALLPSASLPSASPAPTDTVMVSADEVFLPFPDSDREQSSVGLAAGATLDDAARRAVAEQVERQVFRRALRGLARPLRLDRSSDGVRLQWSSELGHTVICEVRMRPRPPYVTLGLGCSLDPDQAAAKAARERRHVHDSLLAAIERGDQSSEHRSGLDRLLWRVANDRPAGQRVVAALTGDGGSTLDAAADVGVAYATVDVTTIDVAALSTHVVRAVAWPTPADHHF